MCVCVRVKFKCVNCSIENKFFNKLRCTHIGYLLRASFLLFYFAFLSKILLRLFSWEFTFFYSFLSDHLDKIRVSKFKNVSTVFDAPFSYFFPIPIALSMT